MGVIFAIDNSKLIDKYSAININRNIEGKNKTLRILYLDRIEYLKVYSSGLIEIKHVNNHDFYNDASISMRLK